MVKRRIGVPLLFFCFLIIHFINKFMLKIFVIGHLGKDANVNTTTNGTSVINFSVAHSEAYIDKQGNKVEKTTWCDCSWWTEKHAVVPYLKKGTQVFVEGIPEIKTFSKQDGSTGSSLAIRVMSCQLLGGKKEGQTTPAGVASPTTTSDNHRPVPGYTPLAPGPGAVADDLPF